MKSCSLAFLSLLFSSAFLLSSASDYIIVGAGTTGCALAARLCALRPESTVTLLERSAPRNESQQFMVSSPHKMLAAWVSLDLVDAFQSLPSSALHNRSFRIFGGKTLGGLSAVNGMQYTMPVTGTVEQFNIDGLTTENSLKYFKKAIDQIGIAIPEGNIRHEYVHDAIRAAELAGFSKTRNLLNNSNSRLINENFLAVDKQGFRRDSCTAYLSPALSGECRQNLRLIQNANVVKILLSNSKQRRAVGVEYVSPTDKALSNPKRLTATKEVIVCAGPFGSPKLLQLSGIGSPDVLRKAGVKVQVSLPVGLKCQSRAVAEVNALYPGMPLNPPMNSSIFSSEEAVQMFTEGKGGVLGVPVSFATGKDKLQGYFELNGHFFPNLVDVPLMNAACLNNVASFGHVLIKDANPFSPPEVQLSLLQRSEDLKRMMKCLNDMVVIFGNFPKRFNITIVKPLMGEVSEDFLRQAALWGGHAVGGCEVGGVLRGDLSVLETVGLRVVDASALPTMPLSAGPMGVLYMIAEYMAEVIAGLHNTQPVCMWPERAKTCPIELPA